jgi:hypothetical protein
MPNSYEYVVRVRDESLPRTTGTGLVVNDAVAKFSAGQLAAWVGVVSSTDLRRPVLTVISRVLPSACSVRTNSGAHKAELHLEASLGLSEQLAGPADAARSVRRTDVDAPVTRLGLAIERPLERRCQAGVDLAKQINS